MKNFIFVILLTGLALLIACSSDDTVNGPDPEPVTRLVANSTATEPTLSSPDEATWNGVTGATAQLEGSGAIAKVTTAASEVSLKAIVKSNKLYVRMEWTDDSNDLWRDCWRIINPSSVIFTRDLFLNEDHALVMFKIPGGDSWDAWNWRSLTTGSVDLAEGKTYNGTSFVTDAGAQTPVKENVIVPIPSDNRPRWIHTTKSAFEEPFLFMSDAYNANTLNDYGIGWTMDQKVAGWIPDLSVLTLLDANPESRWDIKTVSSYTASTNKYKLVMVRDLNSGFTEDLNMSTLDSVLIKVGVVDDSDILGSNNNSFQRFSKGFWLVLP